MDEWQKYVYEKCSELVNQGMSDASITIEIRQEEAYVIMKALEAQQKYENPILEIPAESIG